VDTEPFLEQVVSDAILGLDEARGSFAASAVVLAVFQEITLPIFSPGGG